MDLRSGEAYLGEEERGREGRESEEPIVRDGRSRAR